MKRNTVLATHFRKRAFERLGINANRQVKNHLIKLIQNNGAEVVERQSLSRAIYKIKIPFWLEELKEFDYIYAVYDKNRHKLVTVLTEDMLNEKNSD